MQPTISIITPTTGSNGLYKLIRSIDMQEVPVVHILLWDDKRDCDFLYPNPETLKVKDPYSFNSDSRYSIIISGSTVQGMAYGSTLRSVGIMSAQTDFITFADSDVFWEKDHLKSLLSSVKDKAWGYCKRKIWSNKDNGLGDLEYLGIDEFESVGDSDKRKVPYEMVDNNCMIFSRRLGTSGAVIYRERNGEYNDDRLFYAFLKQYGGVPGKSNLATVNQICPKRLEQMFRENCTKNI